MTDIKPGSRWLLPVEFMHQTGHTATTTDGAGWFFGGGRTVFVRDRSPLIPADRITELEAEVARLKSELEKLNAHNQ